MLTNEVNRLETNSVTRDEYNSLKQSNDTKLSASEFQTFKSDLSDRLTEIDGDLKAIRMELVNHNAHLAR